jgi:endoglucanase
MKKRLLFMLFFALFFMFLNAQSTIKINQIGYLTDCPKYAWVNDIPAGDFTWVVKQASDNKIVYSAISGSSQLFDTATGEKVTCLDLSALKTPGEYYLEINGTEPSFSFKIAANPYGDVWRAGIKSYYFQRSGMDLTSQYAGIWTRQASHTKDAILYAGYENGKIKEGRTIAAKGGWYDAGDFGKKIIPASVAFYSFLKFASLYPEKVKKMQVVIPNPWKGLPDMLAEVKWELDWFFRMQESDGSVHHQIVSPEFFIGPAQNDILPRYVMPVSSAATADFAASMAMAAGVYKPYLPDFADSCKVAAEKAWNFLETHPEIVPDGGYRDPKGINATGAYEDPVDKDERIWAASELFNLTGKSKYNDYFEENCSAFPLKNYGWWYDPHNYSLFTWLMTGQPGRNAGLVYDLKKKVKIYADSLAAESTKNGYGVILSPEEYIWGSNSYVANYGMELLIIDLILNTSAYENIALHQLNYLLGCNSLNLSFVSGYGQYAVKDPHQSINTYDNLDQAPPGFIPGGPNKFKQDPYLPRLIETKNPAPAKCYVDYHWSYACNEVCVPYNSGFVFLSGYFLEVP